MSSAVKSILLIAWAGVFIASCAHTISLGPAHVISGNGQPAVIELKDYFFNPNHVVILDTVSSRTLRLTNNADTRHNFTLVDPDKKIVLSRNLDPRTSIAVHIESLPSANYVFYCNRFLHRYRGMEGMLMID